MRWKKADEQLIIHACNFWYLNSWTQYLTELTLVGTEGLITTQFISINGESGNWGSVLDADSLNCPCGIVGLDTPEEKKGNQKLLLKFLLRKFSSEEVEASQDEGASWFWKLYHYLSKYFQPGRKTKFQPKTELSNEDLFAPSYNNNMDTDVSTNSEQQNQSYHLPIRSSYNLQRLKDFKINGSIEGPGKRDKFSYTSLAYQIQNGRTAGFSEAEICAGVIKAIAPGAFLRLYLESKSFLNVS